MSTQYKRQSSQNHPDGFILYFYFSTFIVNADLCEKKKGMEEGRETERPAKWTSVQKNKANNLFRTHSVIIRLSSGILRLSLVGSADPRFEIEQPICKCLK